MFSLVLYLRLETIWGRDNIFILLFLLCKSNNMDSYTFKQYKEWLLKTNSKIKSISDQN